MAVTAVIELLSAAAVLFAVGTKPSLGLKVGDCFTLDRHTSIEQISAVPCAFPHGTEVYAAIEDPAPADAPYPGIEVVRARRETRLRGRLRAIRWCAVHDRDDRQTTGSSRGFGG